MAKKTKKKAKKTVTSKPKSVKDKREATQRITSPLRRDVDVLIRKMAALEKELKARAVIP